MGAMEVTITSRLLKRLFKKIAVSKTNFYNNSPCWEWTAYRCEDGYGRSNFQGKCQNSHRVTYLAFIGPIPDGREIDHLCKVRHCVNPAHLEAITHAENVRRSESARPWTHCAQGHEMTPENTYVKGRRQKRSCRTCELARIARKRRENPEPFREKVRRYREANYEKVLAKGREYDRKRRERRKQAA